MAEKAGREYAQKHGVDVVTVHPSTCLGPLLQPGLNASSAVLLNLLQGPLFFSPLYSQMIWLMEFVVYNFTGSQDTQGDCWLGCVHVQDVAEAHVLLYQTASASGRYLCTNGIYQFKDFATKVAELYPQYPVHRYPQDPVFFNGMFVCYRGYMCWLFYPMPKKERKCVVAYQVKKSRMFFGS